MFINKKATWFVTPLLILILALIASGCSSGAKNKETTINVTMTDFAFQMDKTSVPAGQVTFQVKNTGGVEHEMVVLKTDLDPKQLPTNSDQTVAESKLDNKGEVEEVAPGGTGSVTLTLDPGKYVLLCNITGHYTEGMVTGFTVK